MEGVDVGRLGNSHLRDFIKTNEKRCFNNRHSLIVICLDKLRNNLIIHEPKCFGHFFSES